MDNNSPVEPLQNPGEASQPSVLDRILHRSDDAPAETAPVVDNVQRNPDAECINPSCTATGKALGDDGICATCGFNNKERF